MSARLKLKRINDRINGVMKMAQKAQYERDEIHRSGWNGKGMFAVLQKGYPQGIPCNKQTAEAWGLNEGDLFRVEPYMQLKMVNGSHSMWVPSVNDCLSNDWAIVVTDVSGSAI